MEQNISLSRGERILSFLVTILLPVASFLITTLDPDSVSPIYVNENPSDYALILLRGDTSIYFYPFLVYSMICMFMFLWTPERYSKYFLIRFGIYTGSLLALQYSIITLIVAKVLTLFLMLIRGFQYGIVFLAEGLLVPGIINGMHFLAKKRKRNTYYIPVGLILFILIFLHLYIWEDTLLYFVGIIFVFGSFWCFIITINISIKLLKIYEFSMHEKRKLGIGLIAWLLPFLGSWRLAYLKMLEIYSSFPSPPHCYIATAVAKGHPHFVKSKLVSCENGCVVWINSQLRIFKCAELILCTVWPRAHRIVRAIYDVLGPPLSRLIIHPIQADVIYMILKPVEWLTKGIMRVIIPDFELLAETIYQS